MTSKSPTVPVVDADDDCLCFRCSKAWESFCSGCEEFTCKTCDCNCDTEDDEPSGPCDCGCSGIGGTIHRRSNP